jgi:hypothetical protein
MRAIILEDNRDRQLAMNERLKDRFPFLGLEFFDSASNMNEFLSNDKLDDIVIVSLDHDLDLLPSSSGEWIDPGTGMDVVRRLTERFAPLCPVVVHTTNALAGAEMMELLLKSQWTAHRVVPYGDLEWIDADWFPAVRNAIVGFAPRPLSPPLLAPGAEVSTSSSFTGR